MREQLICLARMNFQQLDIRPIFDGIRRWMLTSVDRCNNRDRLVKELDE